MKICSFSSLNVIIVKYYFVFVKVIFASVPETIRCPIWLCVANQCFCLRPGSRGPTSQGTHRQSSGLRKQVQGEDSENTGKRVHNIITSSM